MKGTLSQQYITTVSQLVNICQRDVSSDLTTAQTHCLLQSATVDLFDPCTHAKPLCCSVFFESLLISDTIYLLRALNDRSFTALVAGITKMIQKGYIHLTSELSELWIDCERRLEQNENCVQLVNWEHWLEWAVVVVAVPCWNHFHRMNKQIQALLWNRIS